MVDTVCEELFPEDIELVTLVIGSGSMRLAVLDRSESTSEISGVGSILVTNGSFCCVLLNISELIVDESMWECSTEERILLVYDKAKWLSDVNCYLTKLRGCYQHDDAMNFINNSNQGTRKIVCCQCLLNVLASDQQTA